MNRSFRAGLRFHFFGLAALAAVAGICGCGASAVSKKDGGAATGGSGNGSGGGPAGSGGVGSGGNVGQAGQSGTLLPCEGPDLGAGAGGASGGTTPGGAVSLDGTNWVTVASAGNYVPTTGFTWEAWFKGSSLPTDTVPGNMDASHNGQMLFVVANGQACVDVNLGLGGTFTAPAVLAFTVDGPNGCGNRDTTPVAYRPPGGFQNQRWYHVAGVRSYDNSCAGLYLDGVLVASKMTTAAPIQGTGFAAHIGRWNDGGYNSSRFQGLIDEVRVYGRPLSASEIANHFNGGSGRPGSASEPGLVAGWHLDETTGNTATDFGPNHLDGTYTASVAHAPGIVPSP